jgi:Mlc titration factor MtfA (ptsG expression regulator)
LGRAWRQHREQRILTQRAVPDVLWQWTLARYPFLAALTAEEQAALRRLSTLFLAAKEFTAGPGLVLSDEIAVAVAAQACLPILHLGLDAYDGFVGIVLHADEVVARRQVTDDDGVVHEYDETLTGEAMDGGPVMLAWRDVQDAGESADWGYNVVIHEFAHVLDMGDGEADGVPPLPGVAEREAWMSVLDPAYESFCTAVDAGHETLLDPYGATGVDEFFAVAAESFFVTPNEMRAEHPDLYGLLARYFRQDPAASDGG